MYFFSGRLIALNKAGIQSFYYNSDHRILSTTSNALEGDLTNNTTVFGLGIIISCEVVPDNDGKNIVISTVLHSDYNPEVSHLLQIWFHWIVSNEFLSQWQSKTMCTFTVEYRCRPTRLLEKMQTLFQKGREVQITGHIVGWSDPLCSWIVDVCPWPSAWSVLRLISRSHIFLLSQVTGISLTTGSESGSFASAGAGTSSNISTPAGRNRNRMYVSVSK